MLSGRLLRNSCRLRETYIEISTFFRTFSLVSSNEPRRSVRPSISHNSFRTKKRCFNSPSPEDVTKGFPSPPEPGTIVHAANVVGDEDVGTPTSTENAALDSGSAAAKGGHERGGQTIAMSPSSEESYSKRRILNRYDMQRTLPSDVTLWRTLKNPLPSIEPIPVKVYGFLTTMRRVPGFQFWQLADPSLQHTIQIVIPRSRKNGQKADEMVSKVASEAAEEEAADSVHNDQDLELPLEIPAPGLGYAPFHEDNYSNPRAHMPVLIEGHLTARPAAFKKSTPRKDEKDYIDEHADKSPNGRADGAEPAASVTEIVLGTAMDPYIGQVSKITHAEIRVTNITSLNGVSGKLAQAKPSHQFPPEQRVSQFRTSSLLREAIKIRSKVMYEARKHLAERGFDEIETPVLFKSTSEGAREFIVPTRKYGTAYALPQSPQQYKQVLMASGFSRYFQFARCFRDEDMRADRQPEFTQLDLEMSFVRREDVMTIIENLVRSVWPLFEREEDVKKPASKAATLREVHDPARNQLSFVQMTYHEAMATYGSDKPDPRLKSEIQQIDDWIPDSMKAMLTPLSDPIMEMMKIGMNGLSVDKSLAFVSKFMDSSEAFSYTKNPAGAPGIAIYNPSRPLKGLASFGHEGAARVEELLYPEPGDIIVVQARPRAPFSGGSTPLGNLRRDIHQAALMDNLLEQPSGDSFLWVIDFPLFSPLDNTEPGQGGTAGICSTHHPFTAPRLDQDLTKLYTDPLSLIGDHYDLVINGVEVGGGSVRIHNAAVQKSIFGRVLKMEPHAIDQFSHLISALEQGCPPHAGFALGFDRLMALGLKAQSIRDVIAFPKDSLGQDRLVGSPAKITSQDLETYHLAIRKTQAASVPPEPKISNKA